MGGKKKDPADVYRPQMEQAAADAKAISPFEQEYNDYNMKLWNMYTGKEKFDLSKMPNKNALLPMYEQAKARSDRGRIGRGLSYSGNSPNGERGGYNANLIGAIDEQNQSERERDAAGQLEQYVADSFGGIGGKMLGMGQSEYGRRSDNFNRYSQMYSTEANKPKKPKWWESLLGGGMGALGSWAGAGFAT